MKIRDLNKYIIRLSNNILNQTKQMLQKSDPLYWWHNTHKIKVLAAIRMTVYADDINQNNVHRMYTSFGLQVIDALRKAKKLNDMLFCELDHANLRIIQIPETGFCYCYAAFLQYNTLSKRIRIIVISDQHQPESQDFLKIDNPLGYYQFYKNECEKALNIVSDDVRWNKLNSLWQREQAFEQEKAIFFQ